MEVGKEEVITTADGTVFRRVSSFFLLVSVCIQSVCPLHTCHLQQIVLQLECEGDLNTPLVLWDSYVGLVRLLNQVGSLQ